MGLGDLVSNLILHTGVLKNSLQIGERVLDQSAIVNLEELLVKLFCMLINLPLLLIRGQIMESLGDLEERRIVLLIQIKL